MNTQYFIIAICDLGLLPLLLLMFLPFLFGYLLRHFLSGNDRDRILKLESENSSLQAEYSKATSNKNSFVALETEHKKLQQSYKSYETQIHKLKEDLVYANNKSKQVQKPTVDVSQYTSKIFGLENSNAALQKTIDELKLQISAAPIVHVEEKLDIDSNNSSHTVFNDKITYLEAENARLKFDVKAAIEARDNVEKTNENVRKMKEEIREMSGKIGGFTVESDRLKKEAADAKEAAKLALNELDGLKANNSTTNSENNNATSKINDYEAKLKGLESELQIANSKIENFDSLNTELKAAKEKLKEAEINFSNTKLKFEDLQATNLKLTSSVPVEKNCRKDSRKKGRSASGKNC